MCISYLKSEYLSFKVGFREVDNLFNIQIFKL